MFRATVRIDRVFGGSGLLRTGREERKYVSETEVTVHGLTEEETLEKVLRFLGSEQERLAEAAMAKPAPARRAVSAFDPDDDDEDEE